MFRRQCSITIVFPVPGGPVASMNAPCCSSMCRVKKLRIAFFSSILPTKLPPTSCVRLNALLPRDKDEVGVFKSLACELLSDRGVNKETVFFNLTGVCGRLCSNHQHHRQQQPMHYTLCGSWQHICDETLVIFSRSLFEPLPATTSSHPLHGICCPMFTF